MPSIVRSTGAAVALAVAVAGAPALAEQNELALAVGLRGGGEIQVRTGRQVADVLAGEYLSVFKGGGIEFDEVREFAEGDELRAVDWNVTARVGRPHVKKYMEERELTVMLVVDASASTMFGSVNQFKRELAAEVSALLSFAALRNQDRVGAALVSDRLELFLQPRRRRSHVRASMASSSNHARAQPSRKL